jgi:hypothetical protein
MFFVLAGQDWDPLIYVSHTVEMTGVCHNGLKCLLVEMGFH